MKLKYVYNFIEPPISFSFLMLVTEPPSHLVVHRNSQTRNNRELCRISTPALSFGQHREPEP